MLTPERIASPPPVQRSSATPVPATTVESVAAGLPLADAATPVFENASHHRSSISIPTEVTAASATSDLDVAMPRRTGLQAARELARRRPELRVLMLSMHDLEEYCFQALKAGASGYVLKTVADRELVEACRAVMRGEPFLSPPAIRTLMRAHIDDPDLERANPLSPREQEVAKLVAEAHTTEEIAQLLVISPKTVERHRENILAKLGMRDRVELVRYAIRRGLVEP